MARSIGLPLVGLLFWALGVGSSRGDDTPAPGAGPRPQILVHTMPWYEADARQRSWGWHWTMNHFDPNRVVGRGRREVASHLYPEIGPYDSLDPDVLEYQTLLMKLAGIDGVIIDWYGTDDFNDYAGIHRRTLALVEALKRRGLKFAICYEDRVLRAMADRDKWTPEQAVAHARAHLRFVAERWFTDPNYATWAGKPLLMVFGPEYLTPPQWDEALRGLQPSPAFFTLHERKGPAVGSFAWPPMWASKNGTLDPRDLDAYFDRFARQDGAKIPCAFPGFHDIYAEAKVQPSHGFLDPRDGATFRQTLDRALQLKSPIIQVATWNDYGEGTCVEPTLETGTRYLEQIQDARRKFPESGPAVASAGDLKLPPRILRLRREADPKSPRSKQIDAAVSLLDRGETGPAAEAIDRLEKETPPRPPR